MLTLFKGDYSIDALSHFKTLVETSHVNICVVASSMARIRTLRGIVAGENDCLCRLLKFPNGSMIDFVVCGLVGPRQPTYDFIYVDNANSVLHKVFANWYTTFLPTISTPSTHVWIAEGPTFFDELWNAHPQNRHLTLNS